MVRTPSRGTHSQLSIDQLAESAIKADEAEETVARQQARSMELRSLDESLFLSGKWVDRVMPFLRAISDATRLRIVTLLAAKEPLEVGQLAETLSLRSSTVSQHLAILRESKVVVMEKQGIHTRCYLNRKFVAWRILQLKDVLKHG